MVFAKCTLDGLFVFNLGLAIISIVPLLILAFQWMMMLEEVGIYAENIVAWIDYNCHLFYWDKRLFSQLQLVTLITFLVISFGVCLIETRITHDFPRKIVFWGKRQVARSVLVTVCILIPWVELVLSLAGLLGSFVWIVNTVVRHSLGSFSMFLPFISMDKMRLKGVAMKELDYRKAAFKLVLKGSSKRIPRDAIELLTLFVNSIQHQYECCGWESSADYTNATTVPISCCRSQVGALECTNSISRQYGGSGVLHEIGCETAMKLWLNRGFVSNLALGAYFMAVGLLHAIGFVLNRKANERLVSTFGRWNGLRDKTE